MHLSPTLHTNSDNSVDTLSGPSIISHTPQAVSQIPESQSYLSYIFSICNCFKASTQHPASYQENFLLPPMLPEHKGRTTLILDLDETLVHSSLRIMPCDIHMQIELSNKKINIFVAKRPYMDIFLEKCCEIFEVVIFTASIRDYAEPLINILDTKHQVKHRLFREHCSIINSNFVKDLSRLGRDLNNVIIMDNSPSSYLLHPNNALPIVTWIKDEEDSELDKMWGVLKRLAKVKSVPSVIKGIRARKMAFTVKSINNVLIKTYIESKSGSDVSDNAELE